jgi:hypothetical protein
MYIVTRSIKYFVISKILNYIERFWIVKWFIKCDRYDFFMFSSGHGLWKYVNWIQVEVLSKQWQRQVSCQPEQVITIATLKRIYELNKLPLFMEICFIGLSSFKFGVHRKSNFLFWNIYFATYCAILLTLLPMVATPLMLPKLFNCLKAPFIHCMERQLG